MITIDMAQCGDALNMPSVFSLCVRQLLCSSDGSIRKRVNKIRKEVQDAIEHVSYSELNEILSAVQQRTKRYTILTRHDLKQRLNRAGVFVVLSTAALLKDAGTHDAMLFLLHSKLPPYKGLELMKRFSLTTDHKILPS